MKTNNQKLSGRALQVTLVAIIFSLLILGYVEAQRLSTLPTRTDVQDTDLIVTTRTADGTNNATKNITAANLRTGLIGSGSTNITTVGTISNGTWQGTTIATNYLPNSVVQPSGIWDNGTNRINATGGSILFTGMPSFDIASNWRQQLGLGTAATNSSTNFATAAQGTLASTALQPGTSLTNTTGVLALDRGGTGATNAFSALGSLGTPVVTQSPLSAAFKRVNQLANGIELGFGVVSYGDSYSQAPFQILASIYGFRGSWEPVNTFSPVSGTTVQFESVSGPFTKNVNGGYAVLDASGEHVSTSVAAIPCTHVKVVYRVSPGAGSFVIQTQDNGTGSWTDRLTVDASVDPGSGADAAALAVVNIGTSELRSVRAAWVSGSVEILGFGRDFGPYSTVGSRGGIVQADLGIGGTTVTTWASVPQHVWSAWLGGTHGINPAIMTFKADDGGWEAQGFSTVASRILTASPETTIVVQGTHPRSARPTGGALDADEIQLKAYAEANNWLYIPTRLYMPDYTTLNAWGFMADGTHLSASGIEWQNRITMEHLGPLLRPVQNNVSLSGTVNNAAWLQGFFGARSVANGTRGPRWSVQGNLSTADAEFGFANLAKGGVNPDNGFRVVQRMATAATNPLSYSIWNGSVIHAFNRGGLWLISDNVSTNVDSITHPMGSLVTIYGRFNSTPVLSLGNNGTSGDNIAALDIRSGVSATAAGTQVMRMGNATGKLHYRTGQANSVLGTATLVNGTVTVNTTAVSSASRIFLSRANKNASTALGELEEGTKTAGTSFVINAWQAATPGSLETGDQSSVDWFIVDGM